MGHPIFLARSKLGYLRRSAPAQLGLLMSWAYSQGLIVQDGVVGLEGGHAIAIVGAPFADSREGTLTRRVPVVLVRIEV
jgi:hypothetical protein